MKVNNSVPFYYSPDDNPWGSGGALIVNKEDTDVLDDPIDDALEDVFKEPAEVTETAVIDPVETTEEKQPDPVAPPAETVVAPVIEAPKDWRETVSNDDLVTEIRKKLDRKALLTAAGIDEETIKAIEYKESNGGDWNEYLKIKNTDYAKLAPQQLIEMDLKERYAGIDNKRFQIVLKNELRKYNLDRDDFTEESEEAILGSIMLDKDSDQIRAKYLEKQNGLKAPEKQPDTTAQDREIFQQQITANIRNSEPVKNLLSTKLIPFGLGEEAFNYEVKSEVNRIIEATVTASVNNGNNPSEADIAKMFKTLAYHSDPEGVEKALIDHGRILGNRAVRKEVSNTQANESTTSTNFENLSDAELLARAGRVRNP